MKLKYFAKDQNGKKFSSTADAESVADLVVILKAKGFIPLRIQRVGEEDSLIERLGNLNFFRKKVSLKELALFTRQLATTLKAGLILDEALDTIKEDSEHQEFKRIVGALREDVLSGTQFSQALTKYPDVFSQTYISIIKAGEATGLLHKTTADLSRYLEKSYRFREKVKMAVRYPLFVLGFAMVVVMVIVLFLIPKFAQMFTDAKAKLPYLTQMIVNFSEFMMHNIVWIAIVLLLIWGVSIYLVVSFPKIRLLFDKYYLRIPILGKRVIHKALIARFCGTLGFMLSSGVNLSETLNIAAFAVDNRYIMECVEQMRKKVLAGASLSDELRKQSTFPKLVHKMAAVGEKTGQLSDMFMHIAEYYEEEVDTTLQGLTALLEPILIVFIGVIVLIVVLGLYLPIFQMSQAIR